MIDIKIQDTIDAQGYAMRNFTAARMSYEEMFSLGSVLGKIVADNTDNPISALTVLETVLTYAGRQLVYENGQDYTEEDKKIAVSLQHQYITERDKLGDYGYRDYEKRN